MVKEVKVHHRRRHSLRNCTIRYYSRAHRARSVLIAGKNTRRRRRPRPQLRSTTRISLARHTPHARVARSNRLSSRAHIPSLDHTRPHTRGRYGWIWAQARAHTQRSKRRAPAMPPMRPTPHSALSTICSTSSRACARLSDESPSDFGSQEQQHCAHYCELDVRTCARCDADRPLWKA